jgi:hypothetical protein
VITAGRAAGIAVDRIWYARRVVVVGTLAALLLQSGCQTDGKHGVKLRTTLSVEVQKPIDDVFRSFVDPEFSVNADESTVSATLVKGEPFTKGVVWEVKVKAPLVGTIDQTQELTEYDPPIRYVSFIKRFGTAGPEFYSFDTEADGSVRVTWDAEYRLAVGMVLFYPILKWQESSKAKDWINGMKRAIEATDFPPNPE